MSQCYVYDFTFYPQSDLNHEDFIALIRPLFKKFVCQLESTPTTGRLHFQGRGSLYKKKRHSELVALVNTTALKGMHISESSVESLNQEVFYSLKYDTRVEGPWDDRSFQPPPYIPRQFRGLMARLYPWQQTVMDSRTNFQDRWVDCIIDKKGCIGKSSVSALSHLLHGALDLPPYGDSEKLLQAVCNQLVARKERQPGLVFLDCPRSLDQRRMSPYFLAIEQIKRGIVCDTRYHYKEWVFDSPRVWVFMNTEPPHWHLSSDRWRFHQVNSVTMGLEPYEPDEPTS